MKAKMKILRTSVLAAVLVVVMAVALPGKATLWTERASKRTRLEPVPKLAGAVNGQ
jgi:hypothetical protein